MAEDFVATYGLDTRPFAKQLTSAGSLADAWHRERQKGIRKTQEDFVKPFANIRSLSLSVGAGIAGAFYLAAKGVQEYAKVNDYAAERLTRLSRLKEKFYQDIGRNVSSLVSDEDLSRLEKAERILFNPNKEDMQGMRESTPRIFRGVERAWEQLFGSTTESPAEKMRYMERDKLSAATKSVISTIKSELVGGSGTGPISDFAAISDLVQKEKSKLKERVGELQSSLDQRGLSKEKNDLQEALNYYAIQRTKVLQDAVVRPIAEQMFKERSPAFLDSGQNRAGIEAVNFGPRMTLQQKMDRVRETIEKKADQLRDEIKRLGTNIVNLANQPIVYQDPGR